MPALPTLYNYGKNSIIYINLQLYTVYKKQSKLFEHPAGLDRRMFHTFRDFGALELIAEKIGMRHPGAQDVIAIVKLASMIEREIGRELPMEINKGE